MQLWQKCYQELLHVSYLQNHAQIPVVHVLGGINPDPSNTKRSQTIQVLSNVLLQSQIIVRMHTL